MAIAPHKTHGQTEIVNFPHISLMRPKVIQTFKKDFTGIGRIVIDALELFAQPKTRGGRAAAAPLKELGEDPDTGKPIVVKDGRYGPYVTDGETNASLPKGTEPNEITMDQALQLLAERAAKGRHVPEVFAASEGPWLTISARENAPLFNYTLFGGLVVRRTGGNDTTHQNDAGNGRDECRLANDPCCAASVQRGS